MNWHFIINVLVLLLIAYLILSNLDLKINIDLSSAPSLTLNPNQMERFDEQRSLNFLMNNDKYDPTEELLDYINNNNRDIRGLDYYKPILGGEQNSPYFESNLTDIHSFFNLNTDLADCSRMTFDGLDLNKMQQPSQSQSQSQMPERETFEQIRRNHGMSVQSPSQWYYKNEKPMNGGSMNGVTAHSETPTNYAPFNMSYDNQTILSSNQYQHNVPSSNDLRFERRNYADWEQSLYIRWDII